MGKGRITFGAGGPHPDGKVSWPRPHREGAETPGPNRRTAKEKTVIPAEIDGRGPNEPDRGKRGLVVALRADGKTYREIADFLGITPQRAHQIAMAGGAAASHRTSPPRGEDLTGRQFGSLTVTGRGRAARGTIGWACTCACGRTAGTYAPGELAAPDGPRSCHACHRGRRRKAERDAAVVARLLEGALYREVAFEFDMAVSNVARIAARAGLEPRKRGAPPGPRK